jgi:hypothetical protein
MFTAPLHTYSVRFVLIILTLAFAIWAGMTGIAGLYNFQANSYLELWNQQTSKNNAYQTTDDDYQTAVYASKRAIELTPYNGDYLTSAADIQMWQYRNNRTLTPAQKSALKTEILHYYRTALKQRPTWAYTYINFAVTKAVFGEIDTEMQLAIQTANRLGAREPDVIHITLELGLPLWKQMNQNTRLTIASAVERSVTWQLNEKMNIQERIFALSLVGVYQLEKDICPLLTPSSRADSNMCY